MDYKNTSLINFSEETHSKNSVPGGGGVAAYCASLGASLGGMVANFTSGKKKYAKYEEDIQKIILKTDELRKEFINLIDEDAKNFLPLSKAYGLKAQTEEEKKHKNEVISECSKVAGIVPGKLVELCAKSAKVLEQLVDKGSVLLISDVGVGILLIKASMQSGYMNLMINLGSVEDNEYVTKTTKYYDEIMDEYIKLCDDVYSKVCKKLSMKEF